MKRFIANSIFFLLAGLTLTIGSVSSVFAQESKRPKVGVVLCGGGAKGAAHVAVLKKIEEAGIPIDMIVGTSMGAIVGGLYAYGYSTNQLDSLLRNQDWMKLLLNAADREQKDFLQRENEDRYMITFPVFRPKNSMKGGMLSGEAVLNLFEALTPNCKDSMDFANLKIPFACASFDIVKGREVDMYSGILAKCMRASMSIPGAFSPVRNGKHVLVDGCMANNYPADLAKKMGADIIIGVTLNSESEEDIVDADALNGGSEVLLQLFDVITNQKIEENLAQTTIHINVDTHDYSVASFSTEAIAGLLKRGEEAGNKHMAQLLALRDSLALNKGETVTYNTGIPVPKEANDVIESANDKGGAFGIGCRMDNEELASVLVGSRYKFHSSNKPILGAQFRLGRRSYANLSGAFDPLPHWTLAANYKFSYTENRLYSHGERIVDWDFHEHYARLAIYRTWKYLKLTFAADFEHRTFDHMLSSNLISISSTRDIDTNYDEEKNICYYTSLRFDNRNSNIFPTKGHLCRLKYIYQTDNGSSYQDKNGLSVLEWGYEQNIPLSDRITLVPSFWGRFMSTPTVYRLGDRNVIGGIGTLGHYLPQQMPFAGINHFEIINDKFAAIGTTLRGRIGKNHYVYGVGNYGRSSTYLKDFLSDDSLYGAAIGYGYKTPLGPIDCNLNWSNETKELGIWLSFGHMF